jgi:hypothetical protein
VKQQIKQKTEMAKTAREQERLTEQQAINEAQRREQIDLEKAAERKQQIKRILRGGDTKLGGAHRVNPRIPKGQKPL